MNLFLLVRLGCYGNSKRRNTPEADGVIYQGLKDLYWSAHARLLPHLMCPYRNLGNFWTPARQFTTKEIEMLVHRRLACLLERLPIFLAKFSEVCREGCTVHGIFDWSSYLGQARALPTQSTHRLLEHPLTHRRSEPCNCSDSAL